MRGAPRWAAAGSPPPLAARSGLDGRPSPARPTYGGQAHVRHHGQRSCRRLTQRPGSAGASSASPGRPPPRPGDPSILCQAGPELCGSCQQCSRRRASRAGRRAMGVVSGAAIRRSWAGAWSCGIRLAPVAISSLPGCRPHRDRRRRRQDRPQGSRRRSAPSSAGNWRDRPLNRKADATGPDPTNGGTAGPAPGFHVDRTHGPASPSRRPRAAAPAADRRPSGPSHPTRRPPVPLASWHRPARDHPPVRARDHPQRPCHTPAPPSPGHAPPGPSKAGGRHLERPGLGHLSPLVMGCVSGPVGDADDRPRRPTPGSTGRPPCDRRRRPPVATGAPSLPRHAMTGNAIDGPCDARHPVNGGRQRR